MFYEQLDYLLLLPMTSCQQCCPSNFILVVDIYSTLQQKINSNNASRQNILFSQSSSRFSIRNFNSFSKHRQTIKSHSIYINLLLFDKLNKFLHFDILQQFKSFAISICWILIWINEMFYGFVQIFKRIYNEHIDFIIIIVVLIKFIIYLISDKEIQCNQSECFPFIIYNQFWGQLFFSVIQYNTNTQSYQNLLSCRNKYGYCNKNNINYQQSYNQDYLFNRFCFIFNNIMSTNRKKIFISNIYSEIGLELLELYRNDHQDMINYNLIYGTSINNHSVQIQAIHTILNFQKTPNLVLKRALQCDLVILDLIECPIQTQLILKYLKHGNINKQIQIIGISSYMNWCNSKKQQLKQKNDKQTELDAIELLKLEFQYTSYQDIYYQKRVPDHNFLYSYKLQNILLQLNKNSNLSAFIICSGIPYGKTFHHFEKFYEAGLFKRNHMSIYGEGNNYLPMIYLQDLSAMVQKISKLEKTFPKKYFIAVDDSKLTQEKIVSIFCKELLLNKVVKQEVNYNSIEEARFTANIKMTRSSELNNINWKYKEGFSNNKNIILQQFLQYREYNEMRIYLKGDTSQKSLCEKQLSLRYPFFPLLNEDTIEKFIKQIQSDEKQQIAKLIKQEKQIHQKRVQQISLDKKKKHVQIQPYKYSQNIIQNAMKKMVSISKVKGYILNMKYQESIIAFIGQPNIKIVFTEIKQQTEIKYKTSQYKKIFFMDDEKIQRVNDANTNDSNSEDQHQAEKQQSELQGNEHLDSIDQINEDKESNTSNLKQYVVDRVMPSITQIIIEIQQKKPQNIIQYFIDALRKQGEKNQIQQFLID